MKALLLLIGAAPIAIAAPAFAQAMDHSMHDMAAMQMPAEASAGADPHAGHDMGAMQAAPEGADPHAGHDMSAMQPPSQGADPHAGHDIPAMPEQADPHAGHDMSAMQPPPEAADPHAGHDMSAMPGMDAGDAHAGHAMGGTDQPAGTGPAPIPPTERAADAIYGRAAMAEADALLRREHGGMAFAQIMFDLAEYQVRNGRDGYRWEGEAWYGGDINRAVLKYEGEGLFGRALEDAEVQALYSRALDPYWNFQAGIRHDIKPNPSRTYATIGVEGLAPYWFELEGALFLSDKGDLLGRLEGYYDQRISQRMILQPRAELNFAAQDVPENGIGSGLSNIDLGLRLRYEVAREFAPYVGVSYERKVGDTADFARAEGEDAGSTSFVIGVRAWF
ncbi:copper resistance protein CopB [Sphingomonas oleivorans]|uniref:Copper resistance protein CopB n=1 Tax=Sphingomonas oleivorans TaxID=1735121 RepID=A0A2T5FUL3_9SPHN|nr:copper resistance protein B [Sphingomonas oleivorans]PTQ08214.1 copper resistance protein CopB [Sphingomonas oleivorans]